MSAELKTRKYSKEQLVSYLEKHDSTITEAANIAGTNPRTLGRYLEKGVIPSDWLTAIYEALRDRKPAPRTIKGRFEACTACGKKILIAEGSNHVKHFYVASDLLTDYGVKSLPAGGWHWTEDNLGRKHKMYPVCESCYKLINAPKKRAKIVKAAKSK